LFVTHNVAEQGRIGGVEVYVEAMRKQLRSDFDVLVYSLNQGSANAFTLYDERGAVLETVAFDGSLSLTQLANEAKERFFESLLIRRNVRLVHFHHFIGHTFTLPAVTAALGIPAAATFHDFYSLCDSFNLIDDRRRYCDVTSRGAEICDLCTSRRLGAGEYSQQARRNLVSEMLQSLDVLHFASDDALRHFEALVPLFPSEKVARLPLPFLDKSASPRRAATAERRSGRSHSGEPLSVSMIGNFTYEKGADVFIIAAAALADERIQFNVYGRIDDPYSEILETLKLPNVSVRGAYDLSDLPEILTSSDVTCHLSIWPETYCLTLSEAWAYGCVPVVSDIGALAERVNNGVNGLKIAPHDPYALHGLLKRLMRQPSILEGIRANVGALSLISERDHAHEVAKLYREALDRAPAVNGSKAAGSRGLSYFELGRGIGRATRPGDAATISAHEVFAGTGHAHATPMEPYTGPSLLVDGDAVLDTVNGRIESAERVRVESSGVLRLDGWAALDRRPFPDAKLALVQDGLVRYTCALQTVVRNDVAEAFGSPELAGAGFLTTAGFASVDPGLYELAVTDGLATVSRPVPKRWFAIESCRTVVSSGRPQLLPIEYKLDVAGARPDSARGELGWNVDAPVLLQISGHLDRVPFVPDLSSFQLILILRSEESGEVIAFETAGDAGAFRVACSTESLPAGAYAMGVALQSEQQFLTPVRYYTIEIHEPQRDSLIGFDQRGRGDRLDRAGRA
jgi:glycosyltransferase involved in cell wall biosynthesis